MSNKQKVKIDLSYQQLDGRLVVKFVSLCKTELILRYLSYESEILCETAEDHVQAIPAINVFDELLALSY